MATVKYGGGIIQMSGSIAGVTHARNRYGNYTRPRTKPINPRSPGQTQIRNIVSQLAEMWNDGMTSTKRAAWDLYATHIAMKNRLGETVYLTGFNHFIRSNSARLQAGTGIITAGPTTFTLPGKDSSFAVTITAATQVISITFDNSQTWALQPTGRFILFNGRPQLATHNFFNGPWKFVGSIGGNTPVPPASPAVLTATNVFTAGQKAWVYARISEADGRLSEPFRSSILVV